MLLLDLTVSILLIEFGSKAKIQNRVFRSIRERIACYRPLRAFHMMICPNILVAGQMSGHQ
jgi:hypothetical protein